MPEPKKPKLWKLDVGDYSVKLPTPIQGDNGSQVTEINFQVKRSLRELLFNPEQRLTIPEAFDNKDTADKIDAAGDSILLSDKEAGALRRAYDVARSPREHEMEFYRRIRDMEEVEVVERGKKEVL